MKHISFYSGFIETMGYDPQCAMSREPLVPAQGELQAGYFLP